MDGIAVTEEWVYYHAITSHMLYRVPVGLVVDPSVDADELAASVEAVTPTGPHDGMLAGPGAEIYVTSIQSNGIGRVDPDGTFEMVVSDPELHWPDSLALHPMVRCT